MPRVEFGLALDFGTERAPLEVVLQEFRPLLALAEQLGFTSVSVGESYPRGPGAFHLGSPLLILGALANQTGLRLATGVTLLPAWHPLKLAYDTAILDQLSGGRLILGVGSGTPALWQRFGTPEGPMPDRLDETVAALKALWSGANGYAGRALTIEGGIAPLPRQPGGPPVWVGGLVPRAARRAAEQGDGWYASTQYRLDEIRPQVERYHRALAGVGREASAPVAVLNRLTVLAERPEQAWTDGGPALWSLLRTYVTLGALTGPDAPQASEPGSRAALRRACAEICLVGSPETVTREIELYAAAGVTHLQLRVAPAGLPLELALRTIRLAGEFLLPRFRQ